MPAEKSSIGPFIHVWLAISMLLNISGIASIVDGFVTWAGFFRDFIDLYRTCIREPLLWAAHLAWPGSWPRIPGWIVDWFCITGSFMLAANIHMLRREERTLFAEIYDLEGLLGTVMWGAVFVFLGPLYIIALLIVAQMRYRRIDDYYLKGLYRYWFMLLATLVFLMFINWQLKRVGVW